MRTVYLLRHGEPDFYNGSRRCIGQTDLPLSALGRIQARLLGLYLKDFPLSAVYSSNMKRAVETAALIREKPVTAQGFHEINMGEWDGLTFSEIKESYPELYRSRGLDPASFVPPGGERFSEAQARVWKAFEELLTHSSGDIAIAAHSGVNRLILCKLLDRPLSDVLSIQQPYGCCNTIEVNENKIYAVSVGIIPKAALDTDGCVSLLHAAGSSEDIISHCLAVAEISSAISNRLTEAGFSLYRDSLYRGALLHDIARGKPGHAGVGADWLRACGYGELAELVAVHMDLPEDNTSLEAEILFLADKLVLGSKRVTLSERFAESAAKCIGEESNRAHNKRLKRAEDILERISSMCTIGTVEGNDFFSCLIGTVGEKL